MEKIIKTEMNIIILLLRFNKVSKSKESVFLSTEKYDTIKSCAILRWLKLQVRERLLKKNQDLLPLQKSRKYAALFPNHPQKCLFTFLYHKTLG